MKKVLILLYLAFLCLTACQKYSEVGKAELEKNPKIVAQEPGADANVVHNHDEVFTGNNILSHDAFGYCGNTITSIDFKDGNVKSFGGGHSVEVTDLLRYLDYKDEACPCDIEYVIDTEFCLDYGVNLTNRFARRGGLQAELTNEQVQTIKDAVEYAKALE